MFSHDIFSTLQKSQRSKLLPRLVLKSKMKKKETKLCSTSTAQDDSNCLMDSLVVCFERDGGFDFAWLLNNSKREIVKKFVLSGGDARDCDLISRWERKFSFSKLENRFLFFIFFLISVIGFMLLESNGCIYKPAQCLASMPSSVALA